MFTVEISKGLVVNADMVTTVQNGNPPIIRLVDGQKIEASDYEESQFNQLLARLDPKSANIGVAGCEDEVEGRSLYGF